MKKVIYVFLWFCLYLQGCEQKVEYQYDDVNRIYFQYEVLNSLGNKVSLDSVVFSFGKLSDDVVADTAKICLLYTSESEVEYPIVFPSGERRIRLQGCLLYPSRCV